MGASGRQYRNDARSSEGIAAGRCVMVVRARRINAASCFSNFLDMALCLKKPALVINTAHGTGEIITLNSAFLNYLQSK